MLGIWGKIPGFIGISGYFEELGGPLAIDAIFNELEVILLDGPLPGHEGEVEVFTVLGLGVFEDRIETLKLDFFGDLQSGSFTKGWVEIIDVAELIPSFAFGNAWTREDQGHVHGMVVDILFPHQTMSADCETIIRGEYDDGVF